MFQLRATARDKLRMGDYCVHELDTGGRTVVRLVVAGTDRGNCWAREEIEAGAQVLIDVATGAITRDEE